MHDIRHTTYDNNGFTLIEVLATITLIVLALIPIMIIVPQIIENSLDAEQLTKVIFLAEGKIEDVKRSVVNNFSLSRDEPVTAFDAPYGDYKYTVSDNEATGIKIIKVEVWYDENNDDTLDPDEPQITFNTKVADRG